MIENRHKIPGTGSRFENDAQRPAFFGCQLGLGPILPLALAGLVFISGAIGPSPAMAVVTLDVGGTLSPFELGGSARGLGMGNVGVAITGDGDSFYANPAVLGTLTQSEILTFHAPLFLDTIYDAAGFVNPIGAYNSFGLGFARLGTDNVLQTQNNIQAITTFSSEQLEGLAGYGSQIIKEVELGATVRYFHEQLDSYQGSGVGVDVGGLFHLAREPKDFFQFGLKNLTLGLTVANVLQPQVKLFLLPDQFSRVYRPAISYLLRTSPTSRLWVSGEGEITDKGNYLVKAGAEFGWNDFFFARAGFDGLNPTAGAGLRVADFELDYAYNQRDLGSLHRFSLTYRFGSYQDPLQAQRIDLLKWVARSYTRANDYDPAIQAWKNVLSEYPNDPEAKNSIKDLQKRRLDAVEQQIREAQAAVARGDFEKALPLIAKVFSLDPGNPQARELLKRVDKKLLVSTNYMRGVEAYGKEDYEAAVEYLQTVYEVDPSYRDVRHLYHDAQSHYQPLKSMPKELTDLYAKGVDYYMGGHFQKAIDAWQQVLEKDPKNYLVQRNLDEARARLKEKPEPSISIIKDSKTQP